MFLHRYYKLRCRSDTQTSPHEGYSLKVDIHRYFESIAHGPLKEQLKQCIPDDRLLAFCYQIIDSYSSEPGRGLPLGNQSSQWFALLYLNPLDHLIKEQFQIKYYSRYMDDLIIIHEDKAFLHDMLCELKAYATEMLGLEFNEKTQVAPLSQGIPYIGWRFCLTKSGKVLHELRKDAKHRIRTRFRELAWKLNEQIITVDEAMQSIQSIEAHLKHGNAYRIWRELYLTEFLGRIRIGDEQCRQEGQLVLPLEWDIKEKRAYGHPAV